jgi:hypothetical protein
LRNIPLGWTQHKVKQVPVKEKIKPHEDMDIFNEIKHAHLHMESHEDERNDFRQLKLVLALKRLYWFEVTESTN